MNSDGTVYITLHLWGKNLVPDEITALVGMPPSRSRVKGEARSGRQPLAPNLLKVGMWTLSTAQQISSRRISDHLAWLIDKIGDKIVLMKERRLVDQARISIAAHVGESAAGVGSWEDEIDAERLAKVSSLGASLTFTVMWPLPTADD